MTSVSVPGVLESDSSYTLTYLVSEPRYGPLTTVLSYFSLYDLTATFAFVSRDFYDAVESTFSSSVYRFRSAQVSHRSAEGKLLRPCETLLLHLLDVNAIDPMDVSPVLAIRDPVLLACFRDYSRVVSLLDSRDVFTTLLEGFVRLHDYRSSLIHSALLHYGHFSILNRLFTHFPLDQLLSTRTLARHDSVIYIYIRSLAYQGETSMVWDLLTSPSIDDESLFANRWRSTRPKVKAYRAAVAGSAEGGRIDLLRSLLARCKQLNIPVHSFQSFLSAWNWKMEFQRRQEQQIEEQEVFDDSGFEMNRNREVHQCEFEDDPLNLILTTAKWALDYAISKLQIIQFAVGYATFREPGFFDPLRASRKAFQASPAFLRVLLDWIQRIGPTNHFILRLCSRRREFLDAEMLVKHVKILCEFCSENLTTRELRNILLQCSRSGHVALFEFFMAQFFKNGNSSLFLRAPRERFPSARYREIKPLSQCVFLTSLCRDRIEVFQWVVERDYLTREWILSTQPLRFLRHGSSRCLTYLMLQKDYFDSLFPHISQEDLQWLCCFKPFTELLKRCYDSSTSTTQFDWSDPRLLCRASKRGCHLTVRFLLSIPETDPGALTFRALELALKKSKRKVLLEFVGIDALVQVLPLRLLRKITRFTLAYTDRRLSLSRALFFRLEDLFRNEELSSCMELVVKWYETKRKTKNISFFHRWEKFKK